MRSRELGGWSMRLSEGLRDWLRGSYALPSVLCERSCGGDQEHKLRPREPRSLGCDGSIRHLVVINLKYCTLEHTGAHCFGILYTESTYILFLCVYAVFNTAQSRTSN